MDSVREGGAADSPQAEDVAGRVLKLFVSDPHHLFRECLATALARDQRFEISSRAEGGLDLLAELARCPADVLVLGTEELDQTIIRLTRKVAALVPAVKILILGRELSDEQVVDCLLAGAGGFLRRDQSLADVAAAIESVARGERVCPPRVMRLLFARLGQLGRERKQRERLEILELSAREMEILRLIADGLTNQEIACRLCLSIHTVKNHVYRILRALGVQSRWRAVNHAFAKGWLTGRRGP